MMPIITPTGVILGLIFSSFFMPFKPAVNYLFGFLTLVNGMAVSISDFTKVFRKIRALLVFLFASYLGLPVIYTMLSQLFFEPETVVGFVLLCATPTAVVGTIWSSIYGGNRALSLALLVIGTLLAPLMTPLIVSICAGTSISYDTKGMMSSLFFMVLLPSFGGILVNFLTKGKCNDHITPCLRPFTKLALVFVITINTAQVAEDILSDLSWQVLLIALSAVLFFFLSYLIAFLLAKLAKLEKEDTVSVVFASSMKNISAAMVLAIDFFPPSATLPVITGILFQQTTGALASHLLFLRKKK